MTTEEIGERNDKLIDFILGLEMGIHILKLSEQPLFVTFDYKYRLNMYVKNFKLILLNPDGTVYAESRIDKDPKKFKQEVFIDWLVRFHQEQIYVIRYNDLFITGFNHSNQVSKKGPYPVFARHNPLIYTDFEKVESIINKFDRYELTTNY